MIIELLSEQIEIVAGGFLMEPLVPIIAVPLPDPVPMPYPMLPVELE